MPLTLGGRDGALGLCPVCTCPDVQAPEAAPSASKKGDVGAGGTESSSSPPPKYCTYTGAKSVDEAGTTDAADGSATAGCSSSLNYQGPGQDQKLQCEILRHLLEGVGYLNLNLGDLFGDSQFVLLPGEFRRHWRMDRRGRRAPENSDWQRPVCLPFTGLRRDKASNLGKSSNSEISPGVPKAAPSPPDAAAVESGTPSERSAQLFRTSPPCGPSALSAASSSSGCALWSVGSGALKEAPCC